MIDANELEEECKKLPGYLEFKRECFKKRMLYILELSEKSGVDPNVIMNDLERVDTSEELLSAIEKYGS